MLRPALAAVLALACAACPPNEKKDAPASGSQGACTKVGQSCEVSPGKLGTCVQRDDCPAGGACFVCQSQH